MCTDRRDFLRLSAGIAGATLLGNSLAYAHSESIEPQQGGPQPEAIQRLRRMTDNVVPITMDSGMPSSSAPTAASDARTTH